MLSKNSPFNIDNEDSYQEWRNLKLDRAQTQQKKKLIGIDKTVLLDNITMPVQNNKKTPPPFFDNTKSSHSALSLIIEEIMNECEADNYCLYKINQHETLDAKQSKQLIHKLSKYCGLHNLDNNICSDSDNLTSIYQKPDHSKREYIPYTNRKLSWHTDGYYNPEDKTIYSMLLHCFREAEYGGESAFIDHDMIYIQIRDMNPEWIRALSHHQAMTIPANILNGKELRAEQSGPVFSVSAQGRLHMRYSARTRNIHWKEDNATREAAKFIQYLLNNNSEYIIRRKLKSGEGIISRNILHNREAFTKADTIETQRLLFRGRFYDEIGSLKQC